MSCIMKGCSNSRHASKHLNFFKLPLTEDKRKQWLDACKTRGQLCKFPVVCAAHFLTSQIYMKGTRVRLRSGAVPSPLIANVEGSNHGSITKLDTHQKNSSKELPVTEQNVQQKKSKKRLPEFVLEPDDDYDLRCGEVLLTYSGVLVFHCCSCNKKYGNFNYFLKHLSTEHYKHIKEDLTYDVFESKNSESLNNSISIDNISTPEVDNEIKQESNDEDIQEFMKIEIEPAVLQNADNPFNEIEQILIEETVRSQDTDVEYEAMSDEEKTVDSTCLLSSKKDELEEQEQSLSAAVNPMKSKKEKHQVETLICDLCKKIFKNVQTLKRHARVHSTERKYKCEICGLGLKHYSYVKKHMLRHTGEKNISCEICSKKFYTNSEHKLHLRSHTGERPFVCSSCGLAFTNSGALTVHEKIHTQEPYFKCNYCNRGFFSQYRMKVHMIVHTKERPFICPICSASFPRKKSMLRHIDLRHKRSVKKEV